MPAGQGGQMGGEHACDGLSFLLHRWQNAQGMPCSRARGCLPCKPGYTCCCMRRDVVHACWLAGPDPTHPGNTHTRWRRQPHCPHTCVQQSLHPAGRLRLQLDLHHGIGEVDGVAGAQRRAHVPAAQAGQAAAGEAGSTAAGIHQGRGPVRNRSAPQQQPQAQQQQRQRLACTSLRGREGRPPPAPCAAGCPG